MSIEVLLNQFKEASDHPYRRIKAYKERCPALLRP